jgi:hypothetical protein
MTAMYGIVSGEIRVLLAENVANWVAIDRT